MNLRPPLPIILGFGGSDRQEGDERTDTAVESMVVGRTPVFSGLLAEISVGEEALEEADYDEISEATALSDSVRSSLDTLSIKIDDSPEAQEWLAKVLEEAIKTTDVGASFSSDRGRRDESEESGQWMNDGFHDYVDRATIYREATIYVRLIDAIGAVGRLVEGLSSDELSAAIENGFPTE